MSRTAFTLLVALVLVTAADNPIAHKALREPVELDTSPAQSGKNVSSPAMAPRPNPTTVIHSWTFDNGTSPDPQGWSSKDLEFQNAFWHVETATPLSGTKSLYCGAMAACGVPMTCDYLSLPGYGNNWKQSIISAPFSTNGGDLTLQFKIKWDTEPSYDFVIFEYESAGGWNVAETWTGQGQTTINQTIPNSNYSSPIRFRFRFESDGVGSDEDGFYNSTDGAARVDDIVLTESGNPVTIHSENFEGEAAGAITTTDGSWMAFGAEFGDYASLFDGDTVLQEGSTFNPTHVWGFFGGSPDKYTCGVDPDQDAIPLTRIIDNIAYSLHNEIQSPVISLAPFTSSEPVMLTLDVYRDNPIERKVFWQFSVRSRVAGVWKQWRRGANWYQPAKGWAVQSYNLRPLILAGATEIQVGIAAVDRCDTQCGPGEYVSCHSHAPLFDNVKITKSNTPTGPFVTISPVDPNTGTTPVELTFHNVTAPGLTTVTTVPTTGGMPYGSNIFVEISTTASFTGAIDIAVFYNEADLLIPEANLRLLHWDTSLNPDAWVDITTGLFPASNVIYGRTTTLSPFVLAQAVPTGVDDAPGTFALHQNVPNPFNPTTSIRFDVPEGGADVTLRVYDAGGRLVRTLLDERRAAGTHSATWDGRNGMGAPVASGVYFYRLTSGSFTGSKRMVLLK